MNSSYTGSFDRLPKLTGKYRKMHCIGCGTYGEVNKAKRVEDGSVVVIKDVIIDKKNRAFAMKEIEIMTRLKQFAHPNVVDVIDVFRSSGTCHGQLQTRLHIVMDHYPFVLDRFLANPRVDFGLRNVKCMIRQLLSALSLLHDKSIYHRDLKPANVFITFSGQLKIGDFGLSDVFERSSDGRCNSSTRNVVTLWYRPPEILFGDRRYGPEVDLWSAGCVMAEIVASRPLLQGKDDFTQLLFISALCGDLVPETWPGVDELPLYAQYRLQLMLLTLGVRSVKDRLFPVVRDEPSADLISRCLVPCPGRRITAREALEHVAFTSHPLPHDVIAIPDRRWPPCKSSRV